MSAAKRQYLLEIMSEEGRVARIWREASEGAGPDDQIFVAEFEYGLDPDDG